MPVTKGIGCSFVAIAEIAGCYLPYLWLRQGKTEWLLLPGAFSLGLLAWLLSLHPTAAERTYAAYGGVYVAVAVFWLWWIHGVRPDRWDLIGAATLLGMSIIAFGPHALDPASIRPGVESLGAHGMTPSCRTCSSTSVGNRSSARHIRWAPAKARGRGQGLLRARPARSLDPMPSIPSPPSFPRPT